MYRPTLSDPRETSGPRTDRIPSMRPSLAGAVNIANYKILIFFAPSKCPIDLFGLVQQQLGSESREGCAYIRVDAPKQVLALQRVLVRAKMPDAVRGAWVDDEFRRRRPPPD